MKKVIKGKLNINAFVLKTAVAIISIALTLILLLCFNQSGLVFRNIFLQNEPVNTPSSFMRFNEKEIERIVSSCATNFIITKSIIFNVFKFIIFACLIANVLVYVVIELLFKNVQYKFVENKEESKFVAINTNSNEITVFNKVNTKLTI